MNPQDRLGYCAACGKGCKPHHALDCPDKPEEPATIELRRIADALESIAARLGNKS